MSEIRIPQMEPWFNNKEAEAVYEYMKGGGWVMEFKKTAELERMIAEFTGAKHCVMTTNGTISLSIAMLAGGLKAGDEILVPDLTMIASPNAAKLIGVEPVLVDIEATTLCMDLEKAKAAITPKTKALMYVAFNGRSGDMNKVTRFCKEHDLFFIEDAAQALGSRYNKKHLGTFGDVGSFSFSAPKVITMGQGGALITENDELADKMRRVKDFGRVSGGYDIHNEIGWNFKFTDIQAVIGIEQMKKLPERVERKKEIYEKYRNALSDVREVEWIPTNIEDTSPWFIEIFVDDPGALSDYLKEKGIGSRRMYPSIHAQKIYWQKYWSYHFPITDNHTARGLWLPSSSKLTDNAIDVVASAIKSFYSNK
jgi:perosamine synthetase